MKVKDLTSADKMDGKQTHSLVKDLLSSSLKKGKVKAIKLKVKMK